MKLIQKLDSWGIVLLPLLALYGAFELYGVLGLIVAFSYVLIVFGSVNFYYDNKRSKIAFDDEDYSQKKTTIDREELQAFIFTWFVPISFVIIIYLYFEVEYGVLYSLLYILFYSYRIQLKLELLQPAYIATRYNPAEHVENSIDELQEQIKNLQERLNELYDLTGFDAMKLLEIENKKKRVAIIHKLWGIDVEHNWIEKLLAWADLVGVPERDIARDKDKLLEDISYGTIYLDFKNMNLDIIPSEIGYLYTCSGFRCPMNNLIEIPKSIANITSLQVLDLRLNELKHIPSEIGKLTSLQSLDLSSNRLTTIPSEILPLPYLEELILHNNPIDELPNKFLTMDQLKKVTVDSSVKVSSKVREFLGDKLEIVDIGWIQGLWDWADFYNIGENLLPRKKSSLLNIESLKLSVCDNISLSSNKNLNTISNSYRERVVYDSNISKLPKEIGYLIKLKELCISDTKITKLPKEIGNLINLEVLSIDNTNVAELPIEIIKLKNLKKLLMRNTKICELPIEIQNMENLKIWSVDRYN